MKSKLRLFFKEESGVAVIFLAISMVVLMGFTALAVDFGLVYYQRSQLQTALDSAALAAAQKLPDTAAARQTAIEYAKKNGVKVNSDDEIIVEFLDSDSIVRVTASQETKTSFAKVFNVDTIGSVATAAAQSKQINVGVQEFDYLIFSGSSNIPLKLVGKITIDGSVHTNNKYNIETGSGSVIKGEVSGVVPGSKLDTWNCTVGSQKPNANYIPMPDYSDVIYKYVPTYPAFASSDYFDYAQNILNNVRGVETPPQINSDSGTLTGPVYYKANNGTYKPNVWTNLTVANKVYIEGNATFNCKLVMNNSSDVLVVTGNLTVVNGFKCKGTIIVGGDFEINGPAPFEMDGDLYVGGKTNITNSMIFNGNLICKNDFSVNGEFKFNEDYTDDVPKRFLCGGAVLFGSGIKAGNVNLISNGTMTIDTNCSVKKGFLYSGNVLKSTAIFTGSAYIFAENDIEFKGRLDSTRTASEVAIYSINGNINNFSLESNNITGIVYAPNGQVNWGGPINLKGSIIAQSFSESNGQLNISPNPNGNPLATGSTVNRIVLVQ